MAKTKNDEIYERGVRDGQTKGWLDRLVQANIPKISEKDDIYDKGYTFGLKHRPEEKSRRRSPVQVAMKIPVMTILTTAREAIIQVKLTICSR